MKYKEFKHKKTKEIVKAAYSSTYVQFPCYYFEDGTWMHAEGFESQYHLK